MRCRFVVVVSAGMVLAGSVAGVADAASQRAASKARHHQVLLYRADGRKTQHLYLARPGDTADRTAVKLPHPSAFDYQSAALSPAVTRIAVSRYYFHASNGQGHEQIAVMNAKGRHVRVLWRGGSGFTRPVWSPDGKTLYFSTYPISSLSDEPAQLLAIRVDAAHPKARAIAGGEGLLDPAPGPDGTSLAAVQQTYTNSFPDGPASLVVLDLSTGELGPALMSESGVNIDPGIQQPVWSPDGSRIAAKHPTVGGTQDNKTSQILVVHADGSDAGVPNVAANGGSKFELEAPSWRSSRQLWFTKGFSSYGDSDSDPHSRPADLFSISRSGDTWDKPTRRTSTKKLNESSPSFGR